MVEFESHRLLFRIPTEEDLVPLAAYYGSSKVMRYIGSGKTRTLHQTESAITWMTQEHLRLGFGLWATVLKHDQQVIGRCGLIQHMIDGQPELEIAYMLGEPHWGKGYATEAAAAIKDRAVNVLGQKRLVSLIHPDNSASKRVAEKIGMHIERKVVLNGIAADLFALTIIYITTAGCSTRRRF